MPCEHVLCIHELSSIGSAEQFECSKLHGYILCLAEMNLIVSKRRFKSSQFLYELSVWACYRTKPRSLSVDINCQWEIKACKSALDKSLECITTRMTLHGQWGEEKKRKRHAYRQSSFSPFSSEKLSTFTTTSIAAKNKRCHKTGDSPD